MGTNAGPTPIDLSRVKQENEVLEVPEPKHQEDMLASFLKLASLITRPEGDSDKGGMPSKKLLGGWVEKSIQKITTLDESRKRSEEEKRKLEENNKSLEVQVKQQQEKMNKMEQEFQSEQWEKFDLKKKLEAITASTKGIYRMLGNLIENQANSISAASGTEANNSINFGEDKEARETLISLANNLKGVMSQWAKSQKNVEDELKRLSVCVESLLCSSQGSKPHHSSAAANGVPPKKRVRFCSELVQPSSSQQAAVAAALFGSSCSQGQGSSCISKRNVNVEEEKAQQQEEEDDNDVAMMENEEGNLDLNMSLSIDVEEEHGFSAAGAPLDVAEPNLDGSKKFWCLCGKGYSKKHDLSRHLLSKEKGKIFKCPFCSKVFSLHKSVKRHVKMSHKMDYTEGNYGCRVCGATYSTAKDLSDHRKMEHPGIMQFPPEMNDEGESQRLWTNRRTTRRGYLTQEDVDRLLELDNF